MTSPATTQRLSGPRWLVAGRLRRRLAVARFVWSVAPAVLAVPVALLGLLLAGVWAMLLGPVVLVGLGASPAVRRWLTVRYWLGRWHWDARAAGLAVEAEPDLLAGTDGPMDRRVLVVPPVRVRLTPAGRVYRCRPLPGQLLGDYQAACARLMLRWGAVDVAVAYELGAKHVTINVARTVPQVRAWRVDA